MYKPTNFHLSARGHTLDNRIRSLYYKYKYTGFELLRQIPRNAKILDIGCGCNMWKPYFDDLYGIDPYNKLADEMIKFEDYKPHKEFDVFLLLGSINFHSKEYVEMQIEHLSKITKSGDIVFWRQNTGNKFKLNKKSNNVKYFPWSLDHNRYFTEKYRFELLEFKEETGIRKTDDKSPLRYYAKWSKNG